jgi:hypothetical protein
MRILQRCFAAGACLAFRLLLWEGVSLLTHIAGRIYATNKMSRSWLTSLPTAILALFLLGLPCRSMMMYAQAPAHDDCCEDCGDAPKAPSQGCQTLCAASAVNILLQSMDGATTGVPANAEPVALVASDLLFPVGLVAEPIASLSVGSPPLYIQHASLLI